MNQSEIDNLKSTINKAVVLLSGGVDSTTLLHYVKKTLAVDNIYALSIMYGQKHSKELEMAKRQAQDVGVSEHKIIDISPFAGLISGSTALTEGGVDVPDMTDVTQEESDQPVTYVPNRNMLFLSFAAAYAESLGVNSLYYGAQAQDDYGYWDCTIDFIRKINDVLSLNRRNAVTVIAPFVDKTKSEVVKIGLDLGVDYDHTWTCYRGGDEPCGTCPSCVERIRAFEKVCD